MRHHKAYNWSESAVFIVCGGEVRIWLPDVAQHLETDEIALPNRRHRALLSAYRGEWTPVYLTLPQGFAQIVLSSYVPNHGGQRLCASSAQ